MKWSGDGRLRSEWVLNFKFGIFYFSFLFQIEIIRRWSFAEGVKEFAAKQEEFASQECGASSNCVDTSRFSFFKLISDETPDSRWLCARRTTPGPPGPPRWDSPWWEIWQLRACRSWKMRWQRVSKCPIFKEEPTTLKIKIKIKMCNHSKSKKSRFALSSPNHLIF